MSLKKNQSEIKRLIAAFEKEANSFPDITFKTFLISDGVPTPDENFAELNHGIMLWQYYGELGNKESTDSFLKNLQESDSQWGISRLLKYLRAKSADTQAQTFISGSPFFHHQIQVVQFYARSRHLH